jgi:murein DD-endopeptidase MepM/ murein hydrolase activator NlpD
MNARKTASLIVCWTCAFCWAFQAGAFGSGSPLLEDLQVRLVGTVFFQGDASALIEVGMTGEQRFVNLDDTLETFTVGDIQSDRIVFVRDGAQFMLPLRQEAEKDELKIYRASAIKTLPSKASISSRSSSQRPRLAMPYIRNSGGSSPGFLSPMSGTVRSGFGRRRDPLGGGVHFHSGVDIAAASGTGVKAAADGVVVQAGYIPWLGYRVELRHQNDYTTLYGHLSKLAVKKGQSVAAGATIGYEGSSGRSTGPHLHFELRKKGIAVDPSIYVPSLGH